MLSRLILTAVLVVCPSTAIKVDVDQRGGSEMRPDVVAKLLGEVQYSWVHSQLLALSGKASQRTVRKDMSKGCVKIVDSIIMGSDGDHDRVSEYMDIVCSKVADGEHADLVESNKRMCRQFAAGLQAFMTGNGEFNREELDKSHFCDVFYENFVAVAAEQAQMQKRDNPNKPVAKKVAKVARPKVVEAKKVMQAMKAQPAKKALKANVQPASTGLLRGKQGATSGTTNVTEQKRLAAKATVPAHAATPAQSSQAASAVNASKPVGAVSRK